MCSMQLLSSFYKINYRRPNQDGFEFELQPFLSLFEVTTFKGADLKCVRPLDQRQ